MTNILYCGNGKMIDGILTSMLSVLKRTDSREPICFYIFTMDVSHIKDDYLPLNESEALFLRETAKKYNSENDVILVNVDELYKNEFDGCPNEDAYCSPYTLIRLLADLVPEIPDKLLYLDADVMFNKDVHLLYDIDVSSVEYGAARDHYGKFLVKPSYINAGVLLLNMQMIRNTGLFVKARELIRAKKLPFADQSAIIRSTTKRLILPQRFNDQKFLKKSTVVRHFSKRLFLLPYPHAENVKQWQVSRIHKIFGYHEFDDILNEYIFLKTIFLKEEGQNE